MALFLLTSALLGCSFLRPKPGLKWYLVVEVDAGAPNRDALARETANVLTTRLSRIGVSNFTVEIDGAPETGRVRVELADVADRQRLKNFITARGQLQLFHVASNPSPAPLQSYATKNEAEAAITSNNARSKNLKALAYPNPRGDDPVEITKWILVILPAIIDGKDLRNATAIPSMAGDDYEIHFTLKPDAAATFGAWTAGNINQYLGVVLNDEVKSVAYIRTQIYDTGMISGSFTRESAQDLAEILNSGPLPAAIKIVEEGEK